MRLDPGVSISKLDVSPDGAAVGFTTVGPATESLQVATLSDGRITTVAQSPQHPARPAFTAGGRGLAYNLLPGGTADPDVVLVRFG